MIRISIILLIALALLFQGCRTARQVPVAEIPIVTPIGDMQTVDEIILQAIEQRANFDWFSANLSGHIVFGGSRHNIGGQMRIENGERAWITITAVGGFVEVARMLMTPDSVFIHNRLERTAIIRDFSLVQQEVGLDLTFDMLQDILIGNHFLGELSNEFAHDTVDGNFRFTDQREVSEVFFDFVLSNENYRYISLTARNREGLAIYITYGNFAVIDGQLFPQRLHVLVPDMGVELVLHYQRIQLNVPQNMPFTLPASAQRL